MRINSKVVSDKFEDEIVVVNLENGNYYSLKGGAVDIWSGLENGVSISKVPKIFNALSADQENMIAQFVTFLKGENLIILEGDNNPVEEYLIDSQKAFANIEYSKFDDMADLIMIDPIHEVDDKKGWPNKPDTNI